MLSIPEPVPQALRCSKSSTVPHFITNELKPEDAGKQQGSRIETAVGSKRMHWEADDTRATQRCTGNAPGFRRGRRSSRPSQPAPAVGLLAARSSMSQAARFASPGDAEVPILVHSTTSQPKMGSGLLGHATRTAPDSLSADKSFGHPQTSVAAIPALDQGTAGNAYGA